jgi:hypothetical protein
MTTEETAITSPAAALINERHAQFVALGKRNADGVVEQINLAREIGIYLKGERDLLKKARDEDGNRVRWQSQFATAEGKSNTDVRFNFDYMTGHRYIRVADLLPDQITSLPEGVRVLSDVFRMSAELPAPERGNGEKSHDPGYFGKAVKHVTGLLGIFGKWREVEPIEQWPEKRKEDMRAQLKPAVELYNALS